MGQQFNFFILLDVKIAGNNTFTENKDPCSSYLSSNIHAWTERIPGETASLTQQSFTQFSQDLIWHLHCKGLTPEAWSVLQPKYY